MTRAIGIPQRPETNGKSFHHWRTQKEKWLCEKNRLEAQEKAAKLVDIDAFTKSSLPHMREATRIIMSSRLTDEEKHQLRTAIANALHQ